MYYDTSYKIDEQEVDLNLQNVLHILGLHLNLISILRICVQGFDIIFGTNIVIVCFLDGNTTIKRIRINELYLVNILNILQVFLMKSLRKLILMDIWYCHFGYIGINTIRNVVRKS